MLRLPARIRRLPIGLDIGSESIKMLQLRQAAPGAVSVSAAAIWRLPRGSSQDPSQHRQQVIEAVGTMLSQNHFKGRDVVTVLPRGQVGIKNVRLPQMPAKELHEAVKWEAKERFGFELGDNQLGYIQAGEIRSGEEVSQEVVLLAADQKAIEEHVSLLSAARLSPVHIDAPSMAMFRIFDRFHRRQEDEQTSRVAVEIGAGGTEVVVARGHQVVFIKSLDIGGKAMTAAVAKQHNLSEDEAWQLRQRRIHQQPTDAKEDAPQQGQEQPDWNTQDALRGVLESLSEELALSLRYCSVTFRGFRPTQVILCGGEAYDPFVSKVLGERLGMPCVLGRPLQGLDTTGVTLDTDGGEIFAEWAVCAGLAVRCLAESAPALEVDNGTADRLSA